MNKLRFILGGIFMLIIAYSYISNIASREERIAQYEYEQKENSNVLYTLKAINIYKTPGPGAIALGSIPTDMKFKIKQQAFGSSWLAINVNNQIVWVKNENIKTVY